ncbi:MAG: MBL fold metallo-hydrolase [Candidatus Competibacteraceae bacterium]|nr:MBL fold metallo-hydrolase [Candidatus Competibacteraceae bacterium]
MSDLIRYDHGIYAIDSGYIRPRLAAVHLIVERGQVAIVDTASNACLPRVLDALARLDLAPDSVAYVFLTHIHLDHAGGAGAMMRAFPQARLIVHPRGARHMADPTKLFAAVQDVYGAAEARHLYGDPVPIPAERIQEAGDGFSFDLAGRTLVCLDTPGHARHHLCLLDTRSGCLFTGDIFGMSFRELDVNGRPSIIPTTSPSQFDPLPMHRSVDRILAHRPPAVYLTHFAQVREVARLGDDLHRLIDAHVAVAERERDGGPERGARILAGLWGLMEQEAEQKNWPVDHWREVVRSDVEISAQGLDHWLGQAS